MIARRHIAWFALPILLLVGVAILGLTSNVWLGWSTATATYALSPLMFIAPVLGALQAHESARYEQSDPGQWIQQNLVQRVRQSIRTLTPSWIAIVSLSAVFALGSFGATAVVNYGLAATSYRPVVGYLALSFLAVALGQLAGKLPWHPALGVGGVFVLVLIVALYVTRYSNTHPAYETPLLPVVALAIAALVTTVLALGMPYRPAANWGVVVLALLSVSGSVLAAIHVRNDAPMRNPDPVCEGDSPQICVWREHSRALPTLREFADRLTTVKPDAMELPGRIQELGLNGIPDASTSMPLSNLNVRQTSALALDLVLTTTNMVFVDQDNSAEGDGARDALAAYLLLAIDPDNTSAFFSHQAVDEAARILELPDAEQRKEVAALYERATKDLRP